MDKASIIEKSVFEKSVFESKQNNVSNDTSIPGYLQKTYWWAYIHPRGVKFFERQWLVNLILWGNYANLRDKALQELNFENNNKTLQIACVYGDLTQKILNQLSEKSTLDVIDVAPIQLKNLSNKLDALPTLDKSKLTCSLQNATKLNFGDNSHDSVVLFFLLHELPEEVRIKVINEAFRVLAPAGKLIFIDYHSPSIFNPLRYIMIPILKWLEPFALDMWNNEITDWIASTQTDLSTVLSTDLYKAKKETFFAGLYQKVVLSKN